MEEKELAGNPGNYQVKVRPYSVVEYLNLKRNGSFRYVDVFVVKALLVVWLVAHPLPVLLNGLVKYDFLYVNLK